MNGCNVWMKPYFSKFKALETEYDNWEIDKN